MTETPKITGANAGGPDPLPMRTRRAARLAQSGRSACPATLEARSGLKSTLLVTLAALVQVLPSHAQSYSLNWFTIDGGGGASTGSVYAVRGTIGQPDASTTTLTGGPFSLAGGFWSAMAIQTPGAPTLSIVPAGPGQTRELDSRRFGLGVTGDAEPCASRLGQFTERRDQSGARSDRPADEVLPPVQTLT